jgi:hypothetical protein
MTIVAPIWTIGLQLLLLIATYILYRRVKKMAESSQQLNDEFVTEVTNLKAALPAYFAKVQEYINLTQTSASPEALQSLADLKDLEAQLTAASNAVPSQTAPPATGA